MSNNADCHRWSECQFCFDDRISLHRISIYAAKTDVKPYMVEISEQNVLFGEDIFIPDNANGY